MCRWRRQCGVDLKTLAVKELFAPILAFIAACQPGIPIYSMDRHLHRAFNLLVVCVTVDRVCTGKKLWCVYESVPQGHSPSHADCAGRHPGGAFMTRGVMAYLPFLQAKKGSWTGAYVASRSCGSTALANGGDSGGLGTVGRGEETRQGRRASCGSRSRPGILAVTAAGKPCKTRSER